MAAGDWRPTRRKLIQAGATTAAAGAVAAVPAEATARTRPHRKVDVVVVGAGLAGLSAARRVAAAGKSVVVLEARNRVGGRTLNHDLGTGPGEVADLGGTFVGPTQDHVLALIKELGIGLFPTYFSGSNVYVDRQGNTSTYPTSTPFGSAPTDPRIAADVALAVTQLDSMAQELDVNAPWTHARAEEWDRQTLDTWLRQNTSGNDDFMAVVSAATEPIFGTEPKEISLLYTLFYIASSGNEANKGTFERNFNTTGGAQEQRIEGGAQLISLKIAKHLGRRVVLNSPVRRIDQGRFGVRVWTEKTHFQGKRVIVAMPPTLAGRITYHGGMPEGRDQLMQRIPQGTLRKFEAIYEKPFWRDAGVTGQAVGATGPIRVTFDASPKDGTPGVILGFVGGREARRWSALSADKRREEALQCLVRFFGPQAANPKDVVEFDWSAETWSRGCPVGVLPPGVLSEFGPALRAPVGKIHWAGTETSTYWAGYMDGAVRSGERAATEVLGEV